MSSGSTETDRPPVSHPGTLAERESAADGLAKAAPWAPPPPEDRGLIASLVQQTPGPAPTRLARFLSEPSLAKSLVYWFGAHPGVDREQIVSRLSRDVARIDALLVRQVNAILHHPAFQRLESSWRGLQYLADRMDAEGDQAIRIKVLSASWKELDRDFERVVEFDQSQLFRKIYDQEFGSPGGEPYGVLIGDYEIHPRPSRGHPHDDIGILTSISQVAAAAFCPFVTSASPAMFGLDDFASLEHRLDHEKTFEQIDYLKWRAFRDSEDSRFVGLTLPRVLMRLPYEDDGSRVDPFRFREDVEGPDRSKYLWGSAAYALAGVMMRAFAQAGWPADIRGVQRNSEAGGLVTGLPVHSFGTDRAGIATKCSTDVTITDELERQLSNLGLVPLCDCQDTEFSAFYSSQSCQKPKKYDRPAATMNARISAMLQYMLCVSRFAHCVKVMSREKVGSLSDPDELEDYLQRWIVKYVTADPAASPETKARFPLQEASVKVRPTPGKPGTYQCVLHLSPHYELDELTASVRLATELGSEQRP